MPILIFSPVYLLLRHPLLLTINLNALFYCYLFFHTFIAQSLERKKGNYCKERLWYEIAAQSSPPFVIRTMRASVLRSNLAIYGFILTQPYMYVVLWFLAGQTGRTGSPFLANSAAEMADLY